MKGEWGALFSGWNRARLAFDLLVTIGAAVFACAFGSVFMGMDGEWALLLAPLIFVASAFLSGIYTRHRVAPGRYKAGLILGVSVFTGAILWSLGTSPSLVLLYFALTVGVLIAPRIFLNVGFSRKRSFMNRTLRESMKEKSPVLVVGGAGYIGSWLVSELLAANRRVRVLDGLLYGRETLKEFIGDPRFELIEGEVSDIGKLAMSMDGVSTVIHLAGLVGDPACAVDEAFTRHTNVIITRMVKEVAKSFGVERFIFASSCSVYGASDKEVDETSKLNPVSRYALSKIDSEKELLADSSDEFHVTILRFATVFGDSRRARFDLVANLFVAQAMTEGQIKVIGPQQWRPFIHCRDVARAVMATLNAPLDKVSGQVFNVGDSSLNMTIEELGQKVATLVRQAANKDVAVNIDESIVDRRNYRVSFAKIRKVLGYQASISMESGLSAIIDGFVGGAYDDYRSKHYSNLESTKEAVLGFHDPNQRSRIYQPLSEFQG